jgi:hypothetical protein
VGVNDQTGGMAKVNSAGLKDVMSKYTMGAIERTIARIMNK